MKIIAKDSIYQKDVANVNIYIPNNRASNSRKNNEAKTIENYRLVITYEYRQKLYLKN